MNNTYNEKENLGKRRPIKTSTRLTEYVLLLFCLLVTSSCAQKESQKENIAENQQTGIRPWSENPSYWEYNGLPVILLGATDNDNLFQNNNLKTHLDSLADIGGNYVRNTMSDRDEGDLKAFNKNEEGKYDLRGWNPAYWEKFENLLKWAEERDIIVQIEIWDRFDHAREEWKTDPYNPKNNVNYTYEEANLDSLYPDHPGSNKQPFFFTVPSLQDNKVLLPYQEAFVKKLLSISLNFDNVLYCIDNETKGVEEWAVFWADFIHQNAGKKQVYLTQMWDDWDIKSDMHKRTLDHTDRYQYIDMSQNSHNTGQLNWDNAQYIFDYIKDKPRPVNSTKIYGSQTSPWINRGINDEHAIQTFFRNVLGGFASSRFHRPPAGLGLNNESIKAIKVIRKLEEKVHMWEIVPRMDLLSENEPNEAYLAAKEGEKYVLYFPHEGEVNLDLKKGTDDFELYWLDVANGEWISKELVSSGGKLTLVPPIDTGSFVVILKKLLKHE
ncbi:putative collagen-binding domain-containing protein [Lunatibacter salilacus]|uniref:putative collagen-binding domain-containing protein n=1 Tax=Lunatibacter salilacus TaxID=2483804 RepID=UPI00131ACCFE|nr:putative collagen-binding domain-containing protein [Lunatibacter salilacus]